MRVRKHLFELFVILISFIASLNIYAFEGSTHYAINQYIAEHIIGGFSLDEYIKSQLGFIEGVTTVFKQYEGQNMDGEPPTISMWLGYGGRMEDNPIIRTRHHFHNPLRTWDEAGLIYGTTLGRSSIIWAQSEYQISGGSFSWQNVRNYFYLALTSKYQSGRGYNFAETFRGLGQLMHLISDASVPEHSRNDQHAFQFTYERWVDQFRQNDLTIFNQWLSNTIRYGYDKSVLEITPDLLAPVPIARIVDTDKYHLNGDNPQVTLDEPIGISEYSNANFLSLNTKFEFFPLPSRDDVQAVNFDIENPRDSSSMVRRPYYWKTIDPPALDGDTGYRLATVSYLCDYARRYFPTDLDEARMYEKPALDENVYRDYAARLIPRAVGYSAALLDYFFRGTIEIGIPDDGFYAITDDPAAGFTGIKLNARNATENGEEMTNGAVELVIKYRHSQGDPFTNNYSGTSPEFSYIVVPEQNNASYIPSDQAVELSFDLSENPIPLWATDVYLQVIYRGKLGNESDAIAVGFRDIEEPTPIDLFNNMDKTCLNGAWYNAGGPEAIAYVDNPGLGGNDNGIADEWDVYSHDLFDIYYRFYPVGQTVKWPSPSTGEYHHYIDRVNAGHFNRGIYVLTDHEINYTFVSSVEGYGSDPWYHYDMKGILYYGAIKNQIEWDGNGYVRYIPTFYEFRGIEQWQGITAINWSYPDPNDTDACPYEELE